MPKIRGRGRASSRGSARRSKTQPKPVPQNDVQSTVQAYERLIEEELQMRQLIINEKRRVMNDLISRETATRSMILENDMKNKYEDLRKEMLDLLTRRDWDLQLVQGKLVGMEKAQEFLMKEKENALQLTTKLQDQLDLTQTMFYEEREMLKSRINQLEKSYQESQNECIEYQNQIRKLEDANRNKQVHYEESLGNLEEAQAPDSPQSASGSNAAGDSSFEDYEEAEQDFSAVDKETAALVAVLRNEIGVYKERVASLQNKLNAKNRDEEKTSLLVAVLNAQLESIREENKHLHETTQKRMDDIKAMQDFVQSEREKHFALLGKAEHAGSEAAVKQTQLQLELDVHKKQVVELSSCLERLTNEHNTLVKKHEKHVEDAMKREQEDYRTNVSLKAIVEKHEDEKERLLEANKKVKDDMFNYKVLTRAEMDSLKSRLHAIQEILNQKEQDIAKVTQSLSSEVDQLKRERDQLWATLQTKSQSIEEEQKHLTDRHDALTKELEDLKRSSAATEKQLYENLVVMTACHDSKKEELERQQARSREKDKEYTNNIVFLRAENENLKSKMTETAALTKQQEKENEEHINQLEKQIADLNSKIAVEYIQRDDALAKALQRADLGERNVRRLQNQLQEAHENTHKKEMESTQAVKALRADARELKSELDLAKRTIERLEGDIGDRANYTHLANMNAHLAEELAGYRAQVDHLTRRLQAAQAAADERAGPRGAPRGCPTCGRTIDDPPRAPFSSAPVEDPARAASSPALADALDVDVAVCRTLPAVVPPRPPPPADEAPSARLDIAGKLGNGLARPGRRVEAALPRIHVL